MVSSNSDSTNYRDLLLEGKRIASLASNGMNPVVNLNKAIELWRDAIRGFSKGSHDYAACLSNEAGARAQLAELGVDPIKNLCMALSLHAKARKEGLKENTESWSIDLMSEGNARLRLARLGVLSEKNLDRAIELFQLSRKKGFKENTVNYAKSLMNEGIARMTLTEFGIETVDNLQKSIRLFCEARQKGFSDKTVEYANSLLNEGTARKRISEFEGDPIPNLRQSIILSQSARNIYSPTTTNYAMTLNNEGNTRALLARLQVSPSINLTKAIDLYQKARDVEDVKGTVLYARFLMNEGSARVDLAGLGESTKDNLLRAVDLFARARKEGLLYNTTEFASAYLNEGSARLELAKSGIEKEINTKKAELNLKSARDVFLKTHSKLHLISCHCVLGELKYFEEKYDEAYACLKEAIGLIEDIRASIKIPEMRKTYLETLTRVYRNMVFISLRLDKPEDAFYFAESIKGRIFLDLIGSEKKAIKGPDSLLKEYHDNLRSIGRIEISLSNRPINPDLELSLSILKRKHDQLLASIKEFDPDYYNLETIEVSSISDIKKMLKGKTLVEYFIGEKLVIFVVNKEFNVRIVDENEDNLRNEIYELRKCIEDSQENAAVTSSKALVRLYDLLVRPVKDLLGEEIIIVPHGILHFVPFQALKGENYLIEEFTVGFAHSASSFKYLRSGDGEGALIVGNATGGLPCSEMEAKRIASYFKVDPVLGSNAKKDIVLRNISGKRIIHFACHGKFDYVNPTFSGIVLNDGLITAIDFMNMNFNAELTVLSACETAISRITRGDEIEGLVRAIQYGGSRLVIASLWNVDDESTFRLFDNFYRGEGDWFQRLRMAAIDLKNRGYPIYDWAPFQIYGI